MKVTQSLPAIKKIYIVKCSSLSPDIMEKHIAGVPVGVLQLPVEVEHYGDGTLEVEEVNEDGSVYEQVTLTYDTAMIPYMPVDAAYVVVDANNDKWLIGQKERPYPLVMALKHIGKDRNVYTVKVTYTRKKALIPCSI